MEISDFERDLREMRPKLAKLAQAAKRAGADILEAFYDFLSRTDCYIVDIQDEAVTVSDQDEVYHIYIPEDIIKFGDIEPEDIVIEAITDL